MRFFVFLTILLLGFSQGFAEGTIPLHDPQNQYRLGLRTFGNWTQGNATGYDTLNFSSYGLTLGMDRQLGHNWLMGFGLGENSTSVKWHFLPNDHKINAFHADLYARRTFEQFYLDVEGNFGFSDHSSQDNATQWNLSGEAGTWWNHGLGKAEPFVRFSHVCWEGNSNETKETLMAGLRYSWKTSTDLTTTVPRFYGGILQELGDRSLFSVSSFGNTPTVFPIENLKVPGTRLFLGGGFTTSMGTSLDISFRYTAEMSSKDTSHTALLGINCNF